MSYEKLVYSPINTIHTENSIFRWEIEHTFIVEKHLFETIYFGAVVEKLIQIFSIGM